MWYIMSRSSPLSLICSPLALVCGFLYPAYASYKALEIKSPEATSQWLMYWVIFSLFTVVEGVADWLISWIPLYYPLKLGFILWLQLPSTQGATRIYMQFVQPQLKLHEGRIDGSLDQARSFATTSVQDIRQKGVATWGSEMLQRAKSSSAAGGSSAQQDNSAHVA